MYTDLEYWGDLGDVYRSRVLGGSGGCTLGVGGLWGCT